jgi:hypothetical protein
MMFHEHHDTRQRNRSDAAQSAVFGCAIEDGCGG